MIIHYSPAVYFTITISPLDVCLHIIISFLYNICLVAVSHDKDKKHESIILSIYCHILSLPLYICINNADLLLYTGDSFSNVSPTCQSCTNIWSVLNANHHYLVTEPHSIETWLPVSLFSSYHHLTLWLPVS